MTVETSYFNKNQVMNLICNLSTFNGTMPKSSQKVDFNGKEIEIWTGRDIISYILPSISNLIMDNNSYDNLKNDFLNKVVIKNGKLLSGGLDKSIFSKTSKGLIHTIYNDLGPEKTKDFINASSC